MIVGECHFCKKQVRAAEGTEVAWYTEILTRFNGNEIRRTSNPVHKKCKKLNGG